MAPRHQATWLSPALLLLWVPGCLSLSGPRRVTGTVGGSLSVECRYEKEFIDNNKYFCKSLCLSPWRIVQTSKSEREVRRGPVSIRDHPANLTFTVTLERLREDDAGTYWCGIDTSWLEGILRDPAFQVAVSVIPGELCTPPTIAAETSTIATEISTVSFTTLATDSTTHSASSQEEVQPMQPWGLRLLLALLALLLLLLGGISLLAWRMAQRRVKAGKTAELPQNSSQAAEQTEPCYENLELHTCPLAKQPAQPMQVEEEYSMVGHPSENLHYTSVVFDPRRQDSEGNRVPSQKPQTQEPVYTMVKKT
ncbi:CMRF35-like molecule 8 [Hippopotamus amphibius kiboko]|uniref:CMRF35-like molecule 8 n=1 Tax=Hippopotamus amphibius kiboko TaxID=575201 RepID=UPI00259A1BE4|nr:CMRF35-like molecule 8 [Hippopotamus amphibius kiboko]